MTSEFTVLWIDDNKERREEKRGGVGQDRRIKVIPLEPMEAASELLSGPDGEAKIPSKPDLALVDWYLHTDDFEGDGPSIEGILRDRLTTTPVYAFSANYGDPTFEMDQKKGEHRFALITSPDRLDDENIINDIEDYRQIQEQSGRNLNGIMKLLGAHQSLEEKVKSTLPQEFAQGLPSEGDGDSDSCLRFARWLRNEFLETPGLLWDDVWTATKLGIDKEQFAEYSSSFSNSKYAGIFSHRNSRWWRDRVRDEIFNIADEENISVSRLWKDAPKVLGVSEEHKSTCEVCDKPQPQTVAAGSTGEKATFQVHYNCSNIEQSRGSTYEDHRVLVRL